MIILPQIPSPPLHQVHSKVVAGVHLEAAADPQSSPLSPSGYGRAAPLEEKWQLR